MSSHQQRLNARQMAEKQAELSRRIERAIAISGDIRTRPILPVSSLDPADFLYDAKGDPR
ncbi:MAG: hypothetical protein HXY22_03190 [Alphaproteobacteria bacterium]|nr:hypothetical protein [Alphaproteobacteria bacterium]